jgi:hypothetical protein
MPASETIPSTRPRPATASVSPDSSAPSSARRPTSGSWKRTFRCDARAAEPISANGVISAALPLTFMGGSGFQTNASPALSRTSAVT